MKELQALSWAAAAKRTPRAEAERAEAGFSGGGKGRS